MLSLLTMLKSIKLLSISLKITQMTKSSQLTVLKDENLTLFLSRWSEQARVALLRIKIELMLPLLGQNMDW